MSASAITVLGEMFYEPGKAFASVREKSQVWMPLLATALLTALVMVWYYSTVDFTWMLDRMLASNPAMKPEMRDSVAKMMSPANSMAMAVVGSIFGVLIGAALFGLYLLLAGKVLGSDIRYGKWFAFAAWSGVPQLLAIPLMALQIATGHGQIGLEDLNMVSLNFLVLHLPLGHAWFGPANYINVLTFWTIALAAIGLRVWTKSSMAACAIVALLPNVLIVGLWAAKIMVFG